MEIRPSTFYDLTKFSNSFYLSQIAFQTLFSNNVFRGEADRVIYASPEFSFRQRLNLLAQAGQSPATELDLPFMSYFRQGNWEIDDRPAVQNATAGLIGFPEERIGHQRMRWLNVKTNFICTIFYSTDADAQLGYELLMWLKHPQPQQFNITEALEYKGYKISVPFIMTIESISFAPNTTEKNWLEHNRIIPISFNVSVRTVMMSQIKQTPHSTLFPDENPPVLTKTVVLDFLSYRYKNSFYDASHIDFEVSCTLDPDISLALIVTSSSSTQETITVNWNYDADFYADFEPNVIVNINGVLDYIAALNAKTITITDLSPESTYNVTIWATSLTKKVVKACTTVTTTTTEALNIKGIKGYTL
jgi:hypothetical protein